MVPNVKNCTTCFDSITCENAKFKSTKCRTCYNIHARTINQKFYHSTKGIERRKRLLEIKQKNKTHGGLRKCFIVCTKCSCDIFKENYITKRGTCRECSNVWVRANRKGKKITDPKSKLTIACRARIRAILKVKGIVKNKTTLEYIGCSKEQLKQHLESQFQPGMTWKNHGTLGWHIDHIIPLASAKTEAEVLVLCHYTNLQPLWAKENIKKSDKIEFKEAA